MFVVPLVALVGCAGAPEVDTGAPPRSLETDGGTYVVAYTPDPDPIPFNVPFDVAFRVWEAGTDLPAAVPIAPTLWMNGVGHDHGMNVVPVLTPLGDGVWAWEGALLHMTGTWDLTVVVDPDGAAEEVVFEVPCCPRG